jgi:phage anti-repressor protein
MDIQAALVKFEYKEPTIEQIATHVGFNENEIKLMTLFWSDDFDKNWIYLSDDMILNSMTNETGRMYLTHFYNQVLFTDFIVDIDYKEIKKDDNLIKKYEEVYSLNLVNRKSSNRKKYYAITGEIYKELLIKSANKKGKDARQYYLKIEKLAIVYHKYIIELYKYIANEKDKSLAILHDYNIELVEFKKLLEKNEIIYIVATYTYAKQGIYKVGRTKTNILIRNIGHNNTHIEGDKVKILKEYRVNDAIAMESYIHKKLKGLLVKNAKEHFMCPFNLLVNIIELILNNDNEYNNTINSIIDTISKLKSVKYNSNHWMEGLDQSIFNQNIQLITDNTIEAVFDITNATSIQKQEFIKKCYISYKETITEPNLLVWKLFQPVLKQLIRDNNNLLGFYKSNSITKYKATEWKILYQQC